MVRDERLFPEYKRDELIDQLTEAGFLNRANAAAIGDEIHELMRVLFVHDRPVKVDIELGELVYREKDKHDSPVKALRKLQAAGKQDPFDRLLWIQAWQSLPPEAMNLIHSIRRDLTWPKESLLKGKNHFPVPGPAVVIPILEETISNAFKSGRKPGDFRDIIAADLLLIHSKATGEPIREPTHEAGSSRRAGRVFDFIELVQEVYRDLIGGPILSRNSGAAVSRAYKRARRKARLITGADSGSELSQ